jgi:hypothetical protein
MRDPIVGIASCNREFSLAAAKKWLDNNGPRPPGKQFPTEEPDPAPATREEIARRDAMKAKLDEQLDATTESLRTMGKISGRRAPLKQVHNPERLVEGLENMKLLRK